MALRPNADYGHLINEVSRLHMMMHQSVGLLWTSHQLVAENAHTHNRQTSMPQVGFVFLAALQPNADYGHLIHEASRLHMMMHQSVGLLWTSHQLVAENAHTHNRQTSMPQVGFEPTTSAGERPQAYDLRLRSHWDHHVRRYCSLLALISALN